MPQLPDVLNPVAGPLRTFTIEAFNPHAPKTVVTLHITDPEAWRRYQTKNPDAASLIRGGEVGVPDGCGLKATDVQVYP